MLGCRLTVIKRQYEQFLKKLKAAGAELIFVFKKTDSIKDSKFLSQYQSEYSKARELICEMRTNRNLDKLAENYKINLENRKFSQLPLNDAVLFVLCQTARQFGKIHGMDSYRNRVAKFQIDLANETKAMAVMGLNSYYFMFDGSWAFWSDREVDMEKMTIRQYDRELVLRHLNITYQQAPLFAAITGGVKCSETSKQLVESFKPSDWDLTFNRKVDFKMVSELVNKQQFPLSVDILDGIVTSILGRCDLNVLEDIKEAIDSMCSNRNLCKIEAGIMKTIKDDPGNLAEEILEGSTIFISPVYLDERYNT